MHVSMVRGALTSTPHDQHTSDSAAITNLKKSCLKMPEMQNQRQLPGSSSLQAVQQQGWRRADQHTAPAGLQRMQACCRAVIVFGPVNVVNGGPPRLAWRML